MKRFNTGDYWEHQSFTVPPAAVFTEKMSELACVRDCIQALDLRFYFPDSRLGYSGATRGDHHIFLVAHLPHALTTRGFAKLAQQGTW